MQAYSDYLWVFTVEKGVLPVKPGKERAIQVECSLQTLRGKKVNVVISNPAASSEAEWHFKAYQFPAVVVLGQYSSIYFKIKEKNEVLGTSKINWEFIGEPPTEKNYTLRITDKKNKSSPNVGTIRVYTCFQKYQSSTSQPGLARPASSLYISQPLPTAQRTAQAVSKIQNPNALFGSMPQLPGIAPVEATRVTFSAAGRREISIKTSGLEKFITFSELPAFDTSPLQTEDSMGKHGFSLNNALWLVTCANLAYKDEEIIYDVCKNCWDMTGCIFLENTATDTRGFIMHNDQILVICFRGTESINNWITNLNFVLVPGRFPDRYTQTGSKVHQGFHEALLAVWDQIVDYVDSVYAQYPHLKLYICGHSLGGALANLCFAFYTLTDDPRPVEAVYTIGQPRAGNRQFKEILHQSAPMTKYIRITNNQDVVPSLAQGQHCGVHVHITSAGRLSLNPPAWRKAVQDIQAMQESAVGMQYAGIADHSAPVYRRIIEHEYAKYEATRANGSTSAYEICEQAILLIDMIVEGVKGVRRFKPQFRAIVANVIKIKPVIDAVGDYLVFLEARRKSLIEKSLAELNKLLVSLQKEITSKRKDTSRLQQRLNSERHFNQSMTKFCVSMQQICNYVHEVLLDVNSTMSESVIKTQNVQVKKYDPADYLVEFTSINFSEITRAANSTGSEEIEDIQNSLDAAETYVESGELEKGLQFLTPIADLPAFVAYATDEQRATYAFLLAKCHAKLQHQNEALQALQQLSTNKTATVDLMKDDAFTALVNNPAFQTLQTSVAETERKVEQEIAQIAVVEENEEYMTKLKAEEIDVLTAVFDDADVTGSGELTLEQFQLMIETLGVENILNQLGWKSSRNVIPQIFKITTRIDAEFEGKVNLRQFLNLMTTLLPSEVSPGMSDKRKISQPPAAQIQTPQQRTRKTASAPPPVWDMFKR